MEILLTNDDSHNSPLFHFAIEHLRSPGHLTIVAPAAEQSWTGKSITRFTNLYVDEIQFRGHQAYCVNGTPADCVNLAIHHLIPARPDYVVSGINIGRNTGLGFMFSSGTVGACIEANIAGIPAIALSQNLDRASYFGWMEERTFRSEVIERLRLQTETLLPRVFEMLMKCDNRPAEPITWNVNLPFHAVPDCRLVNTFLGHTFYGSCFTRTGDRYHHDLGRVDEDQRPMADGVVVREGHVSITRIDVRELGRL